MSSAGRPYYAVDGQGSGLYSENLSLPSYNGGFYDGRDYHTTYDYMDINIHYFLRINCISAVCFGMLLITCLQILALTPSSKRGLPLYTFSLAATVILITRYLLLMILYTTTGYVSAYVILSGDNQGARFTSGTLCVRVLLNVLSPIAYFFIQLCLYIQVRAVLGGVCAHRPRQYLIIIIFLLVIGLFSLLIRIATVVFQTWNTFNLDSPNPIWLPFASDIGYAISIGLWSCVFVIQVAFVLYRRVKMGGPIKRNEALNILMITAFESMVLPLIFSVLQFFPTWILVETDLLLLPTVAIIIPFGSLWASTMQTYDVRSNTFTRPFLEASGQPKFYDQAIRLVPNPARNAERPGGLGRAEMGQRSAVDNDEPRRDEMQDRSESGSELLINGGSPGAAHGSKGTPDSAYGIL